MEVVVDGIAFENHAMRGVSRIYSEILPKMCEITNNIQFTLLTAPLIKQPLSLPSHPQINHYTKLGVQRLFQSRWFVKVKNDVRGRLFENVPLQTPEKAIWHSTYYTLPYIWRGLNVLTVPDMIYELFPHLFNNPLDEPFRKQKRRCIKEADAIICISQSAANDLHAYYDFVKEKPTYIIPLACSEVFCQLSDKDIYYTPPTSRKFILYVGSRYHYKKFNQLLKVYSAWELKSEIDLVVVGEHWNKSEQALVEDLGLERNIHLLTAVTDKELNYLYNLALFFVYPSLYEGFGLPLLEAMRCGCPVVASKIPSTIEVAGECATYFDPDNFCDFMNALTVASKLGRQSKKVKAGLDRSLDFSWDRCARMTLDVYSELLS